MALVFSRGTTLLTAGTQRLVSDGSHPEEMAIKVSVMKGFSNKSFVS